MSKFCSENKMDYYFRRMGRKASLESILILTCGEFLDNFVKNCDKDIPRSLINVLEFSGLIETNENKANDSRKLSKLEIDKFLSTATKVNEAKVSKLPYIHKMFDQIEAMAKNFAGMQNDLELQSAELADMAESTKQKGFEFREEILNWINSKNRDRSIANRKRLTSLAEKLVKKVMKTEENFKRFEKLIDEEEKNLCSKCKKLYNIDLKKWYDSEQKLFN